MEQLKAFIQAARLRTLPLSVSGIIVGCGLAHFKPHYHKVADACFTDHTDYSIFILAILTTIGFQVISNFANDYGDGIKGTDKNRSGEQRLVASGVISAKRMKQAIIVASSITLILALLLIYRAFGRNNFGYSVLFFALGVASVVAAIKYTVGNKAYGYSGFGDLFVLLFFGWLSVVGSYFLYTKHINSDVFLPATTIGLLSVAVLNLNNMRDRINDKKANKNTLVVKIGTEYAKVYHYTLLFVALLCTFIYIQKHYYSPTQLISLVAFIPLLLNAVTVYKNKSPKELDKELKKVALSTFLFAILFAIFI